MSSSGRRALAGLALGNLCLALPRDAATRRVAWQGLPTLQGRRQHDRPRSTRSAALVDSGAPAGGAPRWRGSMPCSRTKRWCWTSGLPCKPAPDRGGDVLPMVRQLMKPPRLQHAQPQPRAQPDLQLLQRQPRRLPPRDAAGYVFWSERVIELDAINPQVAARLARATGPLEAPGRALPQRRPRSHQPAWPPSADLSNDVREVVTRALAD
jgi:aminopeptidase N